MKPIFNNLEKDGELKAIFTIDNEENENSRIYLFTRNGVKKIVPDKLDIYNEKNFFILYLYIPEDGEVDSVIFDMKEYENVDKMLESKNYTLLDFSWLRPPYDIYDGWEESHLPPLKLYKKRIPDKKLVEIGYQTLKGWKLHYIFPTPKFMADFLDKRGKLDVSSYYVGTYTGENGSIPILSSNFPQEIYINESEVVGFSIGEDYYYYDDFDHPSCKKNYDT